LAKLLTPSSKQLKQIRALLHKKTRQKKGLYIVEGIHAIGQAWESGAKFESIIFSPALLNSEYALQIIEKLMNKGIPCYQVTPSVFEPLAQKENPQGVLAVIHRREYNLFDANPQNFNWGVALVNPQDPGNVGTILRTVDAVGASGVIMTQPCVEMTHPSLVRASMGALFWHPLIATTLEDLRLWVKKHGYHLIGTSAHAEKSIFEVTEYPFPLILLFGSEREGLTEDQRAACESVVSLPMLGKTTSLNLSVAAGIILYDVLHKRQKANDR